MKLNTAVPAPKTEEGATAKRITPEAQLRRTVMSCLLWERNFYEDGKSVADRIASLIPKVKAELVAEIAIEAREKNKLRHVPLLIVREMARAGKEHRLLVASTLERVIQRADELSEFLAIYWQKGKEPLSKQVKIGLAKAFLKFNEYQLAKYNSKEAQVKLRDVMFLVHPKPENKAQEKLFKRLANNDLKTPDTWEVALSTGEDKKATWTRLIKEGQLGALAFLRNLRNMDQVGVTDSVIRKGFESIDTSRVLPFRFLTAARYAPKWEQELEGLMFGAVKSRRKLKGKTIILVDVSGSMDEKLSEKSEVTRLDSACGVAMIAREQCDDVEVFTFSNNLFQCPPRRGFALRDCVVNSQPHGSTRLGGSVEWLNQNKKYKRIIVVTDEQSRDRVPNPDGLGYMVNVSTNKNGVGYGAWTHIDGWSDSVLDFISETES